jgi:hypothetical protein
MAWWWHRHQRYIHTYISIYFDNTYWSYYLRSCSSAYPPSKFTRSSYLNNRDMCTLILLKNNRLDQMGRGITQAGFGLQDRHDLWRPPRLHPDSVLVAQILSEKLIKSTFQSIWNHLHIYSESTAVLDLLQSPFQPRCCVTLFWPNGLCIKLSPVQTRPRVGTRPQHPCDHSPTSL